MENHRNGNHEHENNDPATIENKNSENGNGAGMSNGYKHIIEVAIRDAIMSRI